MHTEKEEARCPFLGPASLALLASSFSGASLASINYLFATLLRCTVVKLTREADCNKTQEETLESQVVDITASRQFQISISSRDGFPTEK